MNIIQNPVLHGHWASSRCPAFVAGILHYPYYITLPVGGQIVGEVVGNKFIKNVVRHKHYFRKIQGYCFDLESLKQLKQLGVQFVELREQDTRKTYRVALSMILNKGIDVDEGHGRQLGLPLKYWSQGNELVGEQVTMWEDLRWIQ